MWSWTAITFRIMLIIDVSFVVLLFLAGSFRVEQYNRFKIHVNNGTSHNDSDTSSAVDPEFYIYKKHDIPGGRIVNRLNDIIGFYTVIISTSIVRVIFSFIVTITNCRRADTYQGPSKLVSYSSLISFVNIFLCIILVSMYHEDIGIDLEKELDIHDMIGDKQHSIELIVGLIGIAVNVSALIITCGYDCFRTVESQERVRRLRREAINDLARRRAADRDRREDTNTNQDNDQFDTRSNQGLINQ